MIVRKCADREGREVTVREKAEERQITSIATCLVRLARALQSDAEVLHVSLVAALVRAEKKAGAVGDVAAGWKTTGMPWLVAGRRRLQRSLMRRWKITGAARERRSQMGRPMLKTGRPRLLLLRWATTTLT